MLSLPIKPLFFPLFLLPTTITHYTFNGPATQSEHPFFTLFLVSQRSTTVPALTTLPGNCR